MLKHSKPRDIVEFFLFGLIFVALIGFAGFLETAPLSLTMLVALVVGLGLWITWFILVVRQRAREHRRPDLKIMEAFTAGYLQPKSATPVQIFDQDAHQKEQA